MSWRTLFHRIRFALGRAAPLTIADRRPAIMSEADLDAALARRKTARAARSEASLKGWKTRRYDLAAKLEGEL